MVVKTFMDMDQDSEEEKELYLNLALHLASDFFLKHPDKDVRLLVACCLADIFRIYAPEAPYTSPDKLKVRPRHSGIPLFRLEKRVALNCHAATSAAFGWKTCLVSQDGGTNHKFVKTSFSQLRPVDRCLFQMDLVACCDCKWLRVFTLICARALALAHCYSFFFPPLVSGHFHVYHETAQRTGRY